MNTYVNNIKSNTTEAMVQAHFARKGFSSLAKGWPDFCFFKPSKNGRPVIVFVEVKRADQQYLKPHQYMLRELLSAYGIDVKVCFGLNEDGTPNWQEPKEPRHNRTYRNEIEKAMDILYGENQYQMFFNQMKKADAKHKRKQIPRIENENQKG